MLLQKWNGERTAASYTEPRHHIPNAFRCSKFPPSLVPRPLMNGLGTRLVSTLTDSVLSLFLYMFLKDNRTHWHLLSTYQESSTSCVENHKTRNKLYKLAMHECSNVLCSFGTLMLPWWWDQVELCSGQRPRNVGAHWFTESVVGWVTELFNGGKTF